jgi:hypothetical protein
MKKIVIALIILSCLSVSSAFSDTTYITYPEGRAFLIPQKHAYHNTLVMKIGMSHALYDGKHKRRDNGISRVFLNYDQVLDVIRRIDNLTLGIPKIVYIVGWQYNGHDSKYPAWFEGNEKLKRPGDANSLESLKWLMKEATRYNTTISLHINMFDAYEDSPLWDTYVKNDIIAKNPDGTLRPCEWGWPISYAQEWKTGYAQKRIDSLCNMLPIQKAGTIHIDAFHSWPPVPVVDANGNSKIDLSKGPISPYLSYTIQDETGAQRNIFRYWGSKGIDVTSEGVDFLRETAFDGYQAMAWWYGGLGNYLKYPASYYCGGQDNSEWGKLFGSSMHGEDIIRRDHLNLPGFREQFCLRTVIWQYLNSLNRLYVINNPDYKAVQFSDNVRSSLTNDQYRIAKGDVTLVENGDMLVPALWLNDRSLIAYSRNGYQNKTWELPKEWAKAKTVRTSRISMGGKSQVEIRNAGQGKITLSLRKDEMLLIEKI